MPLLQATVTLLLLWWIFHDPTKRHQMLVALENANLWWLVPGAISFGLVLVCGTMRWHLLLSVQEIGLSWGRTWQLLMIGMFFNLFLLGSTGGDLLKTFYAMREVPHKKTAVFLSIVVDRVVGMFSLMMVTLVICLFSFSTLWETPVTRGLLSTVAIVFGGFLVMLILSFILNHFHLWKRLPKGMPGHQFLVDVATAFSSYARDGRSLGLAFLISIFLNLFLFGSAVFAAYAFGALPGAPGAGPMISVMPIVNTISALPISLSGVGVREGLFETLLNTLYATPKSLAVLISLTTFVLTVFWSLMGGIVYLFYRPSRIGEFSINEMEQQVDFVEQVLEEKTEEM